MLRIKSEIIRFNTMKMKGLLKMIFNKNPIQELKFEIKRFKILNINKRALTV